MSGSLSGKVAIVTGASKGIGAAIAKGLAEAGASVVVNYASSKDGAERVVAEIEKAGGKAVAVHGSVAKAAEVKRLFVEAHEAYGRLDILVNNAGVYAVRSDRGRDRGRVPPRVRHQRARPDPRDAGSGEALRRRGRQRDQHQLGGEHERPGRRDRLRRHQGRARPDHAQPRDRARAEEDPRQHDRARAASRPRARTAPASSAATSRSRWSPTRRSAGSASRTTSPASRCSSPPTPRAGSPASVSSPRAARANA